MSKRVKVDSFADEMAEMIKAYTSDMERGMEDAKGKTAREGAKTLRTTSPKKTGRYAKGWRARRAGSTWIVHNATDYQLTHLLEKGHAKVGGGRVASRPHIAPVEQQVIIGFGKRVEKIIRG